MNDNFSSYTLMKASGQPATCIASAARSDGMDEITLLRMLRKVCGLSLGEAKMIASGGDVFAMRQDVQIGKHVYWEGWTSLDGFYVMGARVANVIGDVAQLADHKRYLVTDGRLCETPMTEPAITQMKVSHLRKPLSERVEGLMQFVDALANCNQQAV